MKIMQCGSLQEVRNEIDRIDREMIRLLAERGGYVRQAAAFKKTMDDVKAPDRVAQVIEKVRAKAAASGADVNIAEAVFRTMIDGFINAEMNEFNGKKEIE